MKPQFAPDATLEEKFNIWIGVVNSEIINISRDYEQFYDGILFHRFEEIKEGFGKFVSTANTRKNLIGPELGQLVQILESLYDQLSNIHQSIAVVAPESEFLDSLNYLANNSDKTYLHILDHIRYIVIETLSDSEFSILTDEIKRKGISIESHIALDTYKNAKPNQKNEISKILIEIRNLLISQSNDEYRFRIESKIGEIDTIVELINLKDNIKEIKDSSEILKQIKENVSIENNKNLNNGYAEEAKTLKTRIDKLELYIVVLFTTIIVAIAFKIIFLLFNLDNFSNIYNFLTFISLILSCSALIAYFVKDRNRLIKLHDHYKMNVLEISTMPEYMRELDKEQRQQLIIDLSNNYFRGANHSQECSNEKTSELEGLKSTISDIAKMVSDIKETVKKP
jgi:hypothetical protein